MLFFFILTLATKYVLISCNHKLHKLQNISSSNRCLHFYVLDFTARDWNFSATSVSTFIYSKMAKYFFFETEVSFAFKPLHAWYFYNFSAESVSVSNIMEMQFNVFSWYYQGVEPFGSRIHFSIEINIMETRLNTFSWHFWYMLG